MQGEMRGRCDSCTFQYKTGYNKYSCGYWYMTGYKRMSGLGTCFEYKSKNEDIYLSKMSANMGSAGQY